MKRHLPLLMTVLLAMAACSPPLRTADLLFHVADRPNHITDVTPSMIDHVAICLGPDSVIEAIPGQGVVVTPLSQVLRREQGYYLRGHVRGAAGQLCVSRAKTYLGLPYDSLFQPTAEAVYCSELVQLSYVDRHGRPLFQPVPMSFHDSTGLVTPYWRQFYARRGLPVPEGEPGTNPAELSRRPQVRLRPLR